MNLEEAKRVVSDKDVAWGLLWARIDEDKKLYQLAPYTMKDYKGKDEPDVDNVTMNEPAVFARLVQATIQAAKQQKVIEGKMPEKAKTLLEAFLDDIEWEINEELQARAEWQLFPWATEQGCIKGRMAERIAFYREGGEVIKDVQPIDPRYLVFETGKNGLLWAAHKMRKTKAKIKDDYGIDIDNAEADVWDYWDKQDNWVWTDEGSYSHSVLKHEPNTYRDLRGKPYVPFVIEVVPVGTMFKDKDSVQHWGESIFFLNRTLYPEQNKTATILQTQNRLSMRPPYNWENPEGTAGTLPELPPSSGATVAAPMGGGWTPVPTPDALRATQLFYSVQMNAQQRGSVANVDYGNLNFPLPAVGILTLMETRDRVYAPLFQTLARLQQQRSRMMILQLIQLGTAIELGQPHKRAVYHPADLKGSYTIKYRYFSKSPQEDAARYTMASAAEKFFPKRDVLENILKDEDPDGTLRRKYVEDAEKLSPKIWLMRVGHALINQADLTEDKDEEENLRREAERIAHECANLIRQEQMGAMPEVPEQKGRNNEMMPLFGKGGGGGGRKMEAPEEKEPIGVD